MGARQEEGRNGGKIEWKLSEVIIRVVARGQNELIGEFKMTADGRVGYEVHVHSNRN